MDRARRTLNQSSASRDEYEPLTDADVNESTALESSTIFEPQDEPPFSWLEYNVFTLLGVAMLWAWNMFLAAAQYFYNRFDGNTYVQHNFQSGILAVSTVTNLGAMLVLTKMQYRASYPYRINCALVINVVAFSLLTASTVMFLDAAPGVYLAFLLCMVGLAAWATALIQNGSFAFAAGFGRPEYMQALMAGQAIAGVLPPIAQVFTVMIFPPKSSSSPDGNDSGDDSKGDNAGESSAFLYFLAAVAVSIGALVAFIPLVRRHNRSVESRMVEQMAESLASIEDAERAARKVTSPWRLFQKLRWLALGLGLTFAETMFFPVFTAQIMSVRHLHNDDGAAAIPLLFRPEVFIPLSFFFWNLGDLVGRMATILPFSLKHRPFALFLLAAARAGFLPLYLLCNIGGAGAVVESDFFYLFVIQIPFGLTNGWLSSSCMMAAGDWVDDGEREAAGGFMGLCLVIGLTVGSLLSFTVSGLR